jgi:hypothetical protein
MTAYSTSPPRSTANRGGRSSGQGHRIIRADAANHLQRGAALEPFSQSLADWTPFYALMGGVAATLLGLLFVSLSLRLDLFHRRAVADVRDFAAFAFGTFLVAIVIAGLALAPRPRQELVALAVLAMGLLGLLAIIGIARVWVRLNPPEDVARPGLSPNHWLSWLAIAALCGAPVGLVIAGVMLWSGHPDALGCLAIVEGWLLGQGTVAAWLVLSHAGGNPQDGGEPS